MPRPLDLHGEARIVRQTKGQAKAKRQNSPPTTALYFSGRPETVSDA